MDTAIETGCKIISMILTIFLIGTVGCAAIYIVVYSIIWRLIGF